MSRVLHSIKNVFTIWLGQMVSVLCTFAVRMVFVRYLSQDYLGLETLFSNVLSILALAELGVGSAIVYSLYEPLAKNDVESIKSLMRLFKRAYIAIGLAIALMGCLLVPHIELFINDAPDIPGLRVYFLFFVFNSAISYFFSYKGALITADQKNYIVALIRYAFQILLSVLQIIALITTGSYLLFLSCMLLSTLLQNIVISVTANRMYPILIEKNIQPINRDVLARIKKNVAGLVVHKASSVVNAPVNGVILSSMTNLSTLAVYGNYLLVVNALAKIVDQMFDAIVSSIGNLSVTESSDRQYEVFRTAQFVNAYLFGALSVCLLPLVNPFVEMAFGESYLFPFHVPILFTVLFFIRGIRDAALSFISAYGLYWQTRIKALVEVVTLTVLSVLLTYRFGIEGLLVANICVQLFISLVVEAVILHKHGLNRSARPYFFNCLQYGMVTVFLSIVSCALVSLIPGSAPMRFLVGGVVSVVVGFGGFAVVFRNAAEFSDVRRIAASLLTSLTDKIKDRKNKELDE